MAKKRRPDPQCKRVYKWTWQWFDWNRRTLTDKEVKAVIKKACEVWDIHQPRFIGFCPKKAPCSVYNDDDQSLRMLPDHCNPATVLHEVAHHIVHVRLGTKYQDHGPEWLGVFLDLLVAFHVAPEDALVSSLKHRRLKFKLPAQRSKLIKIV